MGEFRDRGGEAVWAGIEQKSQYGAENKKRRDTAASRRLVAYVNRRFAQISMAMGRWVRQNVEFYFRHFTQIEG